MHETDVQRSIADVDVAFSSRLTAGLVSSANRLRWVHSSAAAVDGLLPLAALAKRDIVVTNSRGIQAIPIAEQVLAGLLALARRMDLTMAAQRERRWIQTQLCDTEWPWMLHGKSMTILGLGTIGTEVARRAHAFGIRVTGVRRRTDQLKPDFVERIVAPDNVAEALRGCDILVISAPFVANTNALIGAAEIAMLNRGAILANVARGQIVDETAMLQALQNGQLGGAVLDVFHQEPLDPESLAVVVAERRDQSAQFRLPRLALGRAYRSIQRKPPPFSARRTIIKYGRLRGRILESGSSGEIG